MSAPKLPSPDSYSPHPDDPLYRRQVFGDVSVFTMLRPLNLEEVLAVMNQVGKMDSSNRRLWVMTECFALSPAEIQTVASHGRDVWPQTARVAFVAEDDLAFGLLRMLEVYREEDDYETRVFREKDLALQWLQEWSG